MHTARWTQAFIDSQLVCMSCTSCATGLQLYMHMDIQVQDCM